MCATYIPAGPRAVTKWADGFIVNTPHAGRKKLKLEYDDVARWNPRLIYADLTRFGEKGPDAALPDSISQPSGQEAAQARSRNRQTQ